MSMFREHEDGKKHPARDLSNWHGLSWPARVSALALILVVAFLLVRSLGETGRAQHAANNAVKKSNANAVSLDQVKDQIQDFGETFCTQQEAFASLPTTFPTPTTTTGKQLVQSIVTIHNTGQEVIIQLKCPNTPLGRTTPTPTHAPSPSSGG